MPKISISLTEQEELLLAARELVMSTMDLTTQLQELVEKVPAVCKEGSLKSRLSELQLSHFTAKAPILNRVDVQSYPNNLSSHD